MAKVRIRKPPIYRVTIRGFIRVAQNKWFDSSKPEYWSGELELAETRNIRIARRLFKRIKLNVMTPRYKAMAVSLQRYRTIIAERP